MLRDKVLNIGPETKWCHRGEMDRRSRPRGNDDVKARESDKGIQTAHPLRFNGEENWIVKHAAWKWQKRERQCQETSSETNLTA